MPVHLAVERTPAPAQETSSREISLESERRIATVLVTDLTGSTNLLEKMGTEAWVTLMNRILRLLESEIYRFGGQVHQFRGDGLVAFFGASAAHEDDPERSVLAGLSMQRAFHAFADQVNKNQGIQLLLRVGISTGEVILSSVGNQRQHSEDAPLGRAVISAAQMESAAEPGTALVSHETYQLVAGQFEWQPVAQLPVGVANLPGGVHRPVQPCSKDSFSKQSFGLSSPIIGRDAEFKALVDGINNLLVSHGGIISISGEKGMGKSFLVNEVFNYFARQSSLLSETGDKSPGAGAISWFMVRCHSYDQLVPYAIWIDLVNQWLEIKGDEPEEKKRKILKNKAGLLWGERLASEYIPYLATFLSLTPDEAEKERTKYLDAGGLRQQFFSTLRSWIETLSKTSPLIIVFSDLNWADASSLELLIYCLPVCETEQLLWLLTFRLDRTSPIWSFQHYLATNYPHRLVSLNLAPLTRDQAIEFINNIIGEGSLSRQALGLIVKNAEGNPYYIQELIQSLANQGLLKQDEDTNQWHTIRAITSIDIPGSLHSLLLAQVDQLKAEERLVLQMASVIGADFWSNALQVLVPETDRFKQDLTSLQRAQLIIERGNIPELGMQYTFKSALLHDTVYETLLNEQRTIYHSKVAEYLENTFNIDFFLQHFGLLAYHYAQANNSRKELFYTLQFAEQARGIYANTEALELYNRAIELLDEIEATADPANRQAVITTRFEVIKERLELYELTGHVDQGTNDAVSLLSLAEQLDNDPAWLVDALLLQPGVASWTSREGCLAGVPLAQQALSLSRQTGDTLRILQSLWALMQQQIFLGNPEWKNTGEEALDLARQAGNPTFEARILLSLGTTYSWSDQPDKGMDYLTAAIPICEAQGDRITQVNLLDRIGLELERKGNYYRLLKEYDEKRLQISLEIGYKQGEVSALTSCGQVQGVYLGDYDGGITWLEAAKYKAIELSQIVMAELCLVQIFVALERFEKARNILRMVEQVEEEDLFYNVRAGLLLIKAVFYNHVGTSEFDFEKVLEYTCQAEDLIAENPMISRQFSMAASCQAVHAHLKLSQLGSDPATRQNHLAQARHSSQNALNIFEAFGFAQTIVCTSEEVNYSHYLALAANDLQEEARDYLFLAYKEMMRKYEMIPWESEFRRTFLENIPLHREILASYTLSLGLKKHKAKDTISEL
jgi:class 3 adenylate cyclase